MAKLRTENGIIRYKTIPLYPGVKIINKIIATENLSILNKILNNHHIKFVLFYGTLLGAIRNGDFIDHDEDIDLAILETDVNKLFCSLEDLKSAGFEVARYDRKGLLSIIRKGEYIDFYFFSEYSENLLSCEGNLTYREFIFDTIEFEFKGDTYLIPRNFNEYLELEYGVNWQIPIIYNNYHMSLWKIKLFEFKEYLKDYIPNCIYFYLTHKIEKKTESKYLEKINQFEMRHKKLV